MKEIIYEDEEIKIQLEEISIMLYYKKERECEQLMYSSEWEDYSSEDQNYFINEIVKEWKECKKIYIS